MLVCPTRVLVAELLLLASLLAVSCRPLKATPAAGSPPLRCCGRSTGALQVVDSPWLAA